MTRLAGVNNQLKLTEMYWRCTTQLTYIFIINNVVITKNVIAHLA